MTEIQEPKLNEYWTIEYGLESKTKHIVKVLENKPKEIINWRKHSFKCQYDNGDILQVHGECFIEHWI